MVKLKVRLLKWHAGIPVAMIHDEIAGELGVHIRERISIKTSSGEINTIVDIIGSLIRKNEIAVSYELSKRLKLKDGQKVDVDIAEATKSLAFIKEKLNNQTLSEQEIKEIIKDVVDNAISESEIAMFVSAMHKYGMTHKETVYLTKAILETGNRLKLKSRLIADKHSIGGVAGNRTTPLVISICAAAGLIMPKTSSRAITSAAGTADVIETIAKIDFPINELQKIVRKTKACMVWGGGLGMVPADSKIIKVEKLLKIDPKAQLLASIMSKKLAVGSNYILIDIPYGKSAKMNKKKALELKRDFEKLGKYFNKELKCVLTDGSQPIGNGVGPILELIDVLDVLNPKHQGPKDLEDKSVFLAGELLEMTNKAKKGEGGELAKKILGSGKAFEKFKQIVLAQKRKNSVKLQPAKFKKEIHTSKSGKIKEIDNKKINSLARIAGCPVDKSAGLYLYKHAKDKVKKGEPLITIYSETRARLNQAVAFYHKEKPIKI
jgi:AMP phosphorylase